MLCGCCADERKGELFKPHRDRGCTDVLCLLLLIAAVGGLGIISYIAISAHPSLVDDLIYPTDSYGNNCGKPGSGTAELSKVFYPDLDSDIIAHADLIATGQYLTFLTLRDAAVCRRLPCRRLAPRPLRLRRQRLSCRRQRERAGAYVFLHDPKTFSGAALPLSSTFAEATSQLVSPTLPPALRSARAYPRVPRLAVCAASVHGPDAQRDARRHGAVRLAVRPPRGDDDLGAVRRGQRQQVARAVLPGPRPGAPASLLGTGPAQAPPGSSWMRSAWLHRAWLHRAWLHRAWLHSALRTRQPAAQGPVVVAGCGVAMARPAEGAECLDPWLSPQRLFGRETGAGGVEL